MGTQLSTFELAAVLEGVIKDSDTPVDILPFLRENIKSLESLMEESLNWEIPYLVFHGDYMGLKATGYHIDDKGQPYMSDCEYDFVIFTYEGSLQYSLTLLRMLSTIMISDCTGCCNALDFIKLSDTGLLAQGNISNTYHC